LPPVPCEGQETIVVGSKNFEESRLLAEMFSQLIDTRTDLQVERRFGLAGTQICFEALRRGAIDIYPEYTGTGLASLLGEEPPGDADATFLHVRRQFLEKWDLWWLDSLGFENAYELAIRGDLARQKSLTTISDLAGVSSSLKAGLGFEFIERDDGLPGLADAYGLEFKSVQPLQQALKYQAAAADEIQVLDVYTTDGRLDLYDLTVLEDDLGFFPPYEAAPLAQVETIKAHPEIAITLGLLAGSLDEETMRRLNLRLQEQGEAEAVVANDALIELGLVEASQRQGLPEQSETLWRFMWEGRRRLGRQTARHLLLTLGALFAGIAVAVPLGLLLERRRALAEPVIRAVGLAQTIPSIALLAFMIPLLGVGVAPALVALWIYSLFPILRNTFTGVRDAAPKAVDAGTALGMTDGQILRQIRLPLAAPVIMAGIRTAAVITVGTATLAAFIGAGGLGEPIVTGLQLANTRMILSGALPAAALALLVDFVLGRVERRLDPPGLV
jgi:osmoprotectant transport system permease protein